MILSDEALIEILTRRGFTVTQTEARVVTLSGHEPTFVKVDFGVLKLDSKQRPTAVALVVEGPAESISSVIKQIECSMREANLPSPKVNVFPAPPQTEAPPCCNFHATGGHAQDRHGQDPAGDVYAGTTRLRPVSEPITLSGAQTILKEVQEEKRKGDLPGHRRLTDEHALESVYLAIGPGLVAEVPEPKSIGEATDASERRVLIAVEDDDRAAHQGDGRCAAEVLRDTGLRAHRDDDGRHVPRRDVLRRARAVVRGRPPLRRPLRALLDRMKGWQ